MEASMAFALEFDDPELLSFVQSMWVIKNKPISAEDAGEFSEAYKLLEYIEEPNSNRKQSDRLLYGYIDVIAANDPWDELIENVVPYVKVGAKRAVAMITGDEGDYWFSITKKCGIKQIKPSRKWFNGIDRSDAFQELQAVIENI